MKRIIVAVLIIIVVAAFFFRQCANNNDDEVGQPNTGMDAPAAISYSLLNVYPQDTSFFVQGLSLYNNQLYVGTGLEGKSHLMKVDRNTGKVLERTSLPPSEFGEGIAILNDTVYQLTWQNRKVHVYTLDGLRKVKEFNWPYEGWGLTTNGNTLYVSTGGSNIYEVNPHDFSIRNSIAVKDNYGPVGNLNELEWVNGFIYANVYGRTDIVKIDPETGNVVGRIYLQDIWQKSGKTYDPSAMDVLNGIAYDSSKNTFLVTGKLWPHVFEIKLGR